MTSSPGEKKGYHGQTYMQSRYVRLGLWLGEWLSVAGVIINKGGTFGRGFRARIFQTLRLRGCRAIYNFRRRDLSIACALVSLEATPQCGGNPQNVASAATLLARLAASQPIMSCPLTLILNFFCPSLHFRHSSFPQSPLHVPRALANQLYRLNLPTQTLRLLQSHHREVRPIFFTSRPHENTVRLL
ncbi:hypothetical protein F4779DRAFT_374344 [Xylariaceae sp. FL0662B]|nr:hypothetical protein F4779DRAFT_374344 [Xylariaceae sp. FL0662B]